MRLLFFVLTLFVHAFAVAGCDSRSPLRDAGVADDAGAAEDAAAALDAGHDAGSAPQCAEDLRRPFTGPTPCSTETRDCAQACRTRDCAVQCLVDDSDPQCIACWDMNLIACFTRNGCQAKWNCATDCIRTHCSDVVGDLRPCIDANCLEEDLAYADCIEPLTGSCTDRAMACLPE